MVKRQDLSLDFKARRLFTCLMSVGAKKSNERQIRSCKVIFCRCRTACLLLLWKCGSHDDDVRLNVLGCRADISSTKCGSHGWLNVALRLQKP